MPATTVEQSIINSPPNGQDSSSTSATPSRNKEGLRNRAEDASFTTRTMSDSVVQGVTNGHAHLDASTSSGTYRSHKQHHRHPTSYSHTETLLDSRYSVSYTPTSGQRRTVVLCFDGTGDRFDSENSNIVKLVSLLKKDDREHQLVYYQSGIGTYTSPAVANPLMQKVYKSIDTMIAWNLDSHVMEGYQYLMQTYKHGDRIVLFGFSRGAYTARSLAGMLHKVGLLPPNNFQQVPFAYHMYRRTSEKGWEESAEFKKTFSINVQIEFVGVWDTVCSVGFIPRRLPFTTSNTIIKTFRHALALDERRAKFQPNYYHRATADDAKRNQRFRQDTEDPITSQNSSRPSSSQGFSEVNEETTVEVDDTDAKGHHRSISTGSSSSRLKTLVHRATLEERALSENEIRYSIRSSQPTDVREVWFAGCHGDVGGGYVKNDVKHSLASITLRWMIQECYRTNSGVKFDKRRLQELGMDIDTLRNPPMTEEQSPLETPQTEDPDHRHLTTKSNKKTSWGEVVGTLKRQPSVEVSLFQNERENIDVLSPLHDQLRASWVWWILEWLPMEVRYQQEDDEWKSEIRVNRGRPRTLPPGNNVMVHTSVKKKITESNGQYKPMIDDLFTRTITWTD